MGGCSGGAGGEVTGEREEIDGHVGWFCSFYCIIWRHTISGGMIWSWAVMMIGRSSGY